MFNFVEDEKFTPCGSPADRDELSTHAKTAKCRMRRRDSRAGAPQLRFAAKARLSRGARVIYFYRSHSRTNPAPRIYAKNEKETVRSELKTLKGKVKP